MATNINFVNDLNGESSSSVKYNLPRKIYIDSAKRSLADGANVEGESCTYDTMLSVDRMRLLNKASLLITPTSYKEGKLYSEIPTYSSDGDLSVTRATTATRVNSAGLVELVPYNLLTYSEQLSNWTNIQFVTVTDNVETAPNGTLTASRINETAVTNVHRLFLNPTVSANKHTYSVYLKAGTRNWAFLRLDGLSIEQRTWFDIQNGTIGTTSGDHTATIEDAGNGWYRCSVSISGTTYDTTPLAIIGLATANGVWNYAGDVNEYIYAWGAQLVEGTEAKDYYPTETRLNIPRLDYSLGSCPSILVEPQRTNLALYSEQFDNASWVKLNTSVTANTTASPDGNTNADSLVENTATGLHIIYRSFTSVSATTYTMSCYIKPNTRTRVYLRTDISVGTRRTLFDLTGAGSVITLNHTSATITNVGNGWYHCTITFSEGTGGNRLLVVEGVEGTSVNYTGNGLTAFELWGAQLEAGAYATSYIPITSASVTRNVDILQRTNVYTNGWITASGGTWYGEIKNNKSLIRDASSYSFALKNAAAFNSGIYLRQASGAAQRIVIAPYSTGAIPSGGAYTTSTDTVKFAAKWDGTNYNLFVNGVKVVYSIPYTQTLFEFLECPSVRDIPLFINAMALFPTPLTDDQLEALTGEGFDTYQLMAENLNYILQ